MLQVAVQVSASQQGVNAHPLRQGITQPVQTTHALEQHAHPAKHLLKVLIKLKIVFLLPLNNPQHLPPLPLH